jgi:hypothetical protein
VLREWETRWYAENRRIGRRVQPDTDQGNRRVIPGNTPPTKKILKLHKDLRKAESALLVQARTGRIGLAQFLHSRRAPGYYTAMCRCGGGYETPRHMALFCTQEIHRKQDLWDNIGRERAFSILTGTNKGAKHFVRWMMFSGRLGQFSLAKRLLFPGE